MSLLVENDETLISNVTDLSGMDSAFLGEHCFCIGVSGVGIMGNGFCTEIISQANKLCAIDEFSYAFYHIQFRAVITLKRVTLHDYLVRAYQ